LAYSGEQHQRGPEEAVELASRAVELAPHAPDAWLTLGAAHHYSGQWEEAIAALRKSADLYSGDSPNNWLLLAMAHWQLGKKEESRRWYDKATAWMEENRSHDDTLRFRAEADALFGIDSVKNEQRGTDHPTEEGNDSVSPNGRG
jgi:tetratricopeptide (TPR) repeat protein